MDLLFWIMSAQRRHKMASLLRSIRSNWLYRCKIKMFETLSNALCLNSCLGFPSKTASSSFWGAENRDHQNTFTLKSHKSTFSYQLQKGFNVIRKKVGTGIPSTLVNSVSVLIRNTVCNRIVQ